MTRTEAAAITVAWYIDRDLVDASGRVLVDSLMKLAGDLDDMDNTHANYPKLIGAYERAEAALHKRLAPLPDVPDTDDDTVPSLADLLTPVRNQAN